MQAVNNIMAVFNFICWMIGFCVILGGAACFARMLIGSWFSDHKEQVRESLRRNKIICKLIGGINHE